VLGFLAKIVLKAGIVVHTCKSSTQEAEARSGVGGQPGPHRETLSKKRQKPGIPKDGVGT
jgi:hypothetical protein